MLQLRQLFVGEVLAEERHILFHFLVVDARAGDLELRVGQDDLYLVAVSPDVAVVELAEVDVGLHRRIDWNGDAALAQRQVDAELLAENAAEQLLRIVVRDDLVDVALGAVEARLLLYLHDELGQLRLCGLLGRAVGSTGDDRCGQQY